MEDFIGNFGILEDFIKNYGLHAIGIFLFLDDLGLPFPTSTIVFSSAILAKTHPEISLIYLYILVLVIPPISNTILFYCGRHGARKWLDTHGHKFFLPNKRLLKAEQFFDKYGDKTIFFGAMVTTLRPLLSIVAGSVNTHPLKFAIFHFCGVFIWASTIVGTGYFFGEEIWIVLKTNWEFFLSLLLFYIISRFALKAHRLFHK